MPTPPESEGTPEPTNPADALRARLRAVAQAEQSKREEPVTAKPDLGSSGLWEAPKAQVEEPISPFLIPIDDEPLRPHERTFVPPVRVSERAELPKARVVAMPEEAPKPHEHRVSLEAHTEAMLTLLRTDEIDEAIAKQDTPTHDAPSPVIRTRWQLTRELIGVAKSLPPRVLQVIATAIGRDNLEGAKGELIAFRVQNPGPAKDADVVLRTRAKSIQRGVAGALYVEPVFQPNAPTFTPNYESPKSSSGAANLWWIGVVVVLAIVRIAARSNSSSSYDYSYSPAYDSSYSGYRSSLDEYEKAMALAEAMRRERGYEPPITPAIEPAGAYEEPAALDRKAPQEQLVEEMERSLFVLRENDWVTEGQRDQMVALWVTSPFHTDCEEARSSMKGLEKAPSMKGESLALAKRHIKALRTRIDKLCPAPKKGAKAKAKAKPVEMELTDTPPVVEAQ